MFNKEQYKLFSTLMQSRCEATSYDSFLHSIPFKHILLFGNQF